jgi:hypothetical protein
MKASQHRAYQEAVENYVYTVPAREAPRTFDTGVAWGMLAGTCIVLGVDPMGDAVRSDVDDLRRILHAPLVGKRSVQTPTGWDIWQQRLQDWEARRR